MNNDCKCNKANVLGLNHIRGTKLLSPKCDKPGIFFTTEVVPVNMGTSEAGQPFAPKNEAFFNTLVVYQADGRKYLYDSEGNYTELCGASGGESSNIRMLTTDDYNWNSSTRSAVPPYDCIAPWLLDYGLYAPESGVKIVQKSTAGAAVQTMTGWEIIGIVLGSSLQPKALVRLGQKFYSFKDPSYPIECYGQVTWFNEDGSIDRVNCLLSENNINDLSNSSNSTGVLAAKTGKAIQESVGDITTLTTTNKSSAVAAINEINGRAATITMTTTDPGEGSTLAEGQFIGVYSAS